MLAYKKLHTLKTCFPNKAETQSLRQLLSSAAPCLWSHPRLEGWAGDWLLPQSSCPREAARAMGQGLKGDTATWRDDYEKF